MNKKNILFVILLFIMLICVITLSACGLDSSINDLEFTLNEDNESYSVTLNPKIEDRLSIKEIVIPREYNEKPVTIICDDAFKGCSLLTSVTIPDSVISIGKNAFSWCLSLITITIPSSVQSIGEYAFFGCYKLIEVINLSDLNIKQNSEEYGCVGQYASRISSIEKSAIVNLRGYLFITINKTNYLLEYIGKRTNITLPMNYNGEEYQIYKYAFYKRSSLTFVTIPNSVKIIGVSAFEGCSSLTSITIPNSVTNIGGYAFYGCYKLVEVINQSNLNIEQNSDANGQIGKNALRISTTGKSTIVKKNNYLFMTIDNTNYLLGYTGKKTEITLPENYNGEEYIICRYAFYNCSSLTSITIPSGVKTIDEYAFRDCSSLTSIIIPDSVTNIKPGVFSYCSSLTSVSIPSGVTRISEEFFFCCSSLTSISIPNSVISISDKAFYGCSSLTSITIPDSVTSLGWCAFENCTSLTSIAISNNVTSIRPGTFRNCSSLTSITIPKKVAKIEEEAFRDCSSLISIDIPDMVSTIDRKAFFRCSSLTSVTIPNSVIIIGSGAFSNCSNLTFYCEEKSQPSGWDSYWNEGRPVVWDYLNQKN